MRRVGLHLALPADLVRAVDGEARRQLASRSVVVEQALREGLVRRLAADLLRPVLDAEAVDMPFDAEPAPGLPEADPRPTSRHAVVPSVPPGLPHREQGGHVVPGDPPSGEPGGGAE